MLCGRFGWNLPCSTEVENFQIFSIYFYYFAIISPWGRMWAFICKLPRMLCSKFGWNWPSSFKERILNIFNIILLLRFYLPFESGLALFLNKLESPPPKDALCQVWLKLAQKFWRRRFLKFVNFFLLFRYYLPFEKDGNFIWTIWVLTPKNTLCQVWLKLASGSGGEDINVKSLRQRKQQRRQRQQRRRTTENYDQKSTLQNSAQVS